jgi:outer membrane protein, heavy metal efflux system
MNTLINRFWAWHLFIPLLVALPCAAGMQGNEGPAPPARISPLTLETAIGRVFERNPDLTVSELEIEAASARVLQAGFKPNPEITATAENFAAAGGPGPFRSTESTIQLSRRLETGDKRALRVQVEEHGKLLAGKALAAKKLELISAATLAFAEVLAAQERLDNQKNSTRLALQSHQIVLERVAAGKVSPVEQTRATVALASAELDEEKQIRALTAAKDRLASMWGGSHSDFDAVAAPFQIPQLTDRSLSACMESIPDIQLADSALEYRKSLLAQAEASRKPDVTVSAGLRHLNFEGELAWVANVSIPLPWSDKRQGAIAEARILIDKSKAERLSVERRIRSELVQFRNEYESARSEAGKLAQTALPASREAMGAVEEGYRYGKFDFLNVLDAQRTYNELQRRYIDAVAFGLKAAIEIDRYSRCDSGTQPYPAFSRTEAGSEK